MGLRAMVTFDAATRGGVGNGLAAWYGAALAGPLQELVERERQGTVFTLANTRADEYAEEREDQPLSTGWEAMRQELLREPGLAHAIFMREPLGRPFVHIRSASIGGRRPNMGAQLLLGDAMGRAGRPPVLRRRRGSSSPRWTP